MLRFADRLFTREENPSREQTNRWLCQPAVTPILDGLGGIFLPDVLRAVRIGARHGPALVTIVQSTLDALAVRFRPTDRAGLRRIPLGHRFDGDTLHATSTGKLWSGGYLNHRREQYERVRGSLQQRGTQSAHRTIESIGERETRWADDYLHCISKALVQEADAYGCDAIAFEELTHIRDRMPGAKKFHAWAFRRLYEYVEYKAEEYGIDVVQVNPAYTSQRCSKCGTTLEENRPNGDHRFEYQKCGYAVHADYNAAKNIATKHVRRRQKSIGGRPRVNVASKSGTVNANGRYSSTV